MRTRSSTAARHRSGTRSGAEESATELPQDIVEERGYPQLTDQAKRKILGLNLARLHGMDAPG